MKNIHDWLFACGKYRGDPPWIVVVALLAFTIPVCYYFFLGISASYR